MDKHHRALFAVFDGHGGREVAVYCKKHFPEILQSEAALCDSEGEGKWMQRSFLKVDEMLRTEEGQNELGDLRREKPPKKPAILNILGEHDRKNPAEQSNEEMMLDSIGCTANVVLID